MIVLDLSILNQKGTPMFNSDLTANRPAAGIVGRIFIAIDSPFGIFRDTGSAWDQISAGGSGGITGSGAATQVAFWNGTSSITGSNNLFWDSINNYLGINTNVPTTALDVHHSTNSGAIFNQTTATNNNTINFQTTGAGRWRIGNFYTAGADDFGVFDVVGALQQFTIVNTTGQTFVGAKITASGRFVINSATADAHLQIVGANSPSIRIDNAGSGGTQRFVIGLATATNNFIQGATAGEFCISTQSAGNMLFGMWQTTNASEVMRITTANNLLIGSSVDSGQRLQVAGKVNSTGYFLNGMTAGSGALYWTSDRVTLANYNVGGILSFEANGGTNFMTLFSDGNLAVGTTTNAGYKLDVNGTVRFSGAFSGISSTFSSSVTQTGIYPSFYQNPSAWTGGFILQSGVDITASTTGNYNASIVPTGKGWTWIVGGNGGTSVANLSSTGAATFSSSVDIGNSVAVAVAAPSTHKVAILIGGVQYYLLASNV